MLPADDFSMTDYEVRGMSDDQPMSVSQLNWYIKQILEQAVPRVWVEGEISDLSRPGSGHIYFTLKDANSQIRAVIWRSAAQKLPFALKDGLSIVCAGGVEVYEPRGSYQLIINKLQPKGIGPLQLAFQQLHQKLSAEGLFDPNRKRKLPRYPRRIGFVTSPTGAAVHDFLEAARGLWNDFHLVLIPARVQGDRAKAEIVQGIRIAQKICPKLDVLIVGRGGGSIEDLWCFNEEPVIRALIASKIPTVSAVGHEIDVTLSDLAADVRALTPTHAAHLILPNQNEIQSYIQQLGQRGAASIRNRCNQLRQRLGYLSDRSVLARPHEIHVQRRQMIDEWDLRARSAVWKIWESREEKLIALARAASALSPLAVLARGYSVTQIPVSEKDKDLAEPSASTESQTRVKPGKSRHDSPIMRPVTSTEQVQVGDRLTTILHAGRIESEVVDILPSDRSTDWQSTEYHRSKTDKRSKR